MRVGAPCELALTPAARFTCLLQPITEGGRGIAYELRGIAGLVKSDS